MRWANVASTTTVSGVVGVLLEERADGFVELLEAGLGASFGGDVGAVDDDVAPAGRFGIGHVASSRPSTGADSAEPARRPSVASGVTA